jgi:hypothetical protein
MRPISLEDWHRGEHNADFGLYICSSGTDPDYLRVGAAGFKGCLRNRLQCHSAGAANDRSKPPNWTEIWRPWTPIWLFDLGVTSPGVTGCCERLLLAQLSLSCRFVDNSGFLRDQRTDDQICRLANEQVSLLEKLVARQTAEFFQKQPASSGRWTRKGFLESYRKPKIVDLRDFPDETDSTSLRQ